MTSAAELMVWLLSAYAILGLLFALPFVAVGVQRIDSQAHGAGFGFRLIILPGVVALWPLLLRRWLGGSHEPPVEHNPHRDIAGQGG